MAVTRADVARRAGTSPALVSYVLNDGPRRVAPATRERILAAIAELGYRPNAVARSLRMAKGHALGLIVPDASNPFFAGLARAVEEEAFGHGYPLLVGNAADDEEREIGYVHAFVDRQVEGLLAIASARGGGLGDECAKAGIPAVMVDRVVDPERFANVAVDSIGGARLAVEHLQSHGHDRIACLSGPDVSTAEHRVVGYDQAMASAGLPSGPVVRAPFGGASGYAALREIVDTRPAPTAVFVTSDLQALGLLRAAFDAGLSVPSDLALVSFDGIDYAQYARPGLTTVAQPIADLGALATSLLLEEMRSGKAEPGVRVLPTTLVTRGSCGCEDGAE